MIIKTNKQHGLSASPLISFSFSAQNGWIDIVITSASGNTIKTEFSEVFDPLPELFLWLEKIAQGSPHSILAVDREGRYHTWEFSNRNSKQQFAIYEGVEDDFRLLDYKPEFICQIISGQHFVESFLKCWMSYFKSSEYKKVHWEKVDYAQAFQELLGFRLEKTKEYLMKRSAFELGQIFQFIDSMYNSSVVSKDVRNLKKMIEGKILPFREKIFGYFSSANAYNGFSRGKKYAIITRLLHHSINLNSGASPLGINSKIIEKYIK